MEEMVDKLKVLGERKLKLEGEVKDANKRIGEMEDSLEVKDKTLVGSK